METAFESLVRILESDELSYQTDYDRKTLATSLHGENAHFRIYVSVDEEASLLQIFAIVPVVVPGGCRTLVAEAVVRANYGMKVGKFEMDFSDGELRFQIGVPFSAGSLDDEIVRRLLGTAVKVTDLYFPAFMSIIYGNEIPEDAIMPCSQ
jgi:hypothetical protein